MLKTKSLETSSLPYAAQNFIAVTGKATNDSCCLIACIGKPGRKLAVPDSDLLIHAALFFIQQLQA